MSASILPPGSLQVLLRLRGPAQPSRDRGLRCCSHTHVGAPGPGLRWGLCAASHRPEDRVPLGSPFDRWSNRGPGALSNVPEATQPGLESRSLLMDPTTLPLPSRAPRRPPQVLRDLAGPGGGPGGLVPFQHRPHPRLSDAGIPRRRRARRVRKQATGWGQLSTRACASHRVREDSRGALPRRQRGAHVEGPA